MSISKLFVWTPTTKLGLMNDELQQIVDAVNTDVTDLATHAALTSGVHGISAAAATVLDDATVAAMRATLGAGDVVGPSSSPADGEVVVFDGTTGQLLRSSALRIGVDVDAIILPLSGAALTSGATLSTITSGSENALALVFPNASTPTAEWVVGLPLCLRGATLNVDLTVSGSVASNDFYVDVKLSDRVNGNPWDTSGGTVSGAITANSTVHKISTGTFATVISSQPLARILRVKVVRQSASGSDTNTGDMRLWAVRIYAT